MSELIKQENSPWKKVITKLRLIGYDYVLSYEYEDPTMSRLDGLRKTINYLTQLIIEDTTSKFSEEKD